MKGKIGRIPHDERKKTLRQSHSSAFQYNPRYNKKQEGENYATPNLCEIQKPSDH